MILKFLNDWFKLLTPNVIWFSFSFTDYLWLLSHYLWLLGRYFWLLNRYYWFLLVTSRYFSLLLVPRFSNNVPVLNMSCSRFWICLNMFLSKMKNILQIIYCDFPISHILEANNFWLSWLRGNYYIGKISLFFNLIHF